MAKWTETALAAGRISVDGRRIGRRFDGFTKRRREAFLARLAQTCCVGSAVAVAEVTKSAVYATRRRDPAFAEAWRDAVAEGYDEVERSLLRYALSQGAEAPRDAAAAGDEDRADAPANGDGRGDASVPAWVQVALRLIQRHGASVHGRSGCAIPRVKATAAETDAALERRLDQLALRTKGRA